MSKYVILLDGEFVIRRLTKINSSFPKSKDVIDYCNNTIVACPELKDNHLVRIYFYHAYPSTQVLTNPIDGSKLKLGKTNEYKNQMALINGLEKENYVSLRMGEVAIRNWKIKKDLIATAGGALKRNDVAPDVQQKGVDLRIRLDIARISLNRSADKIVVATGDSDIMPCFKFARREGLQVFLAAMGHSVKKSMIVHSDFKID